MIRKYALQNAVKFKGKASQGAIIGKIFAEKPELKKKGKELSKEVSAVLKEINAMAPEDQKKELEDLAPELLEKKKEEKRDIFSFLNFNETDLVNTAFPPGPEKYPHIGHAKALLLNHMLARQYGGKFILRFEDTNPKLAKKEFYRIMEEDFRWLGVDWDELIYASDHMEMFYEKAEDLIRKNLAYVDIATPEEIKKSREGTPTKSRDQSIEENLKLWRHMKNSESGSAILRLKIDLDHNNTTMRDPTIFRILDESHPRTGSKYRIWPNYDFQNAIMDSFSNITIRLRSKEFELRGELQNWIQENLGMKKTATYEFGRFNMTGVESSGRIIREKIEKKELIGWDDPELTTLRALRRRGFQPEAIKHFVISTGISKAESTMTWDDLIMHNKRLLDNSAKRFSAIFDPVNLEIENVPDMNVELHLNPNEKKGGRRFNIKGDFILAKKDIEEMQEKEVTRLMDCVNVMKKNSHVCFDSVRFEDFKGKGKRVINWLPGKDNIDIEVLMPDKSVRKGIAEKTIKILKEGDVIQFERFGFCRLDKIEKDKYVFWFTHK